MRLSGITDVSFVDGPGLRYVIFAQGCKHGCPNCHNQKTWDVNAGMEFSVKEVIRKLKKQNKTANDKSKSGLYQGVTLSGGEPFLQAEELAQVAASAHQIGWDVVTYTGYTYEQLIELGNNDNNIKSLLYETDILIDGKYVHEKRDANLPFRGSANQRIIDVIKTINEGKIVLSRL
ncbi:MAG: anaerobic ribonucleoside-triphosphate reductase activating protein [Treponema sp.]|nr:anaerobic ribonucleoside-triphosphate reductase activating protein [Treponema sp.]